MMHGRKNIKILMVYSVLMDCKHFRAQGSTPAHTVSGRYLIIEGCLQ